VQFAGGVLHIAMTFPLIDAQNSGNAQDAGGAICRRRAANCTDFSTHDAQNFGSAHSS